jgi:hypothetical protein
MRERIRNATRLGVAGVLALLAAGCAAKTRPAFESEAHGLRFVPPPGWSQRARNDEPPAAGKEQLLVTYKRLRPGRMAWLQVSVAENAPEGLPADWLAARPPGGGWDPEGALEDVTCGGCPAARVRYAAPAARPPLAAELVAVRRGGRVYLFTGTFPAGDEAARQEIRRTVDGVTWGGAAAVASR